MQNRLIDAREEKPLQKADKGKGHPRILRANRLLLAGCMMRESKI